MSTDMHNAPTEEFKIIEFNKTETAYEVSEWSKLIEGWLPITCTDTLPEAESKRRKRAAKSGRPMRDYRICEVIRRVVG